MMRFNPQTGMMEEDRGDLSAFRFTPGAMGPASVPVDVSRPAGLLPEGTRPVAYDSTQRDYVARPGVGAPAAPPAQGLGPSPLPAPAQSAPGGGLVQLANGAVVPAQIQTDSRQTTVSRTVRGKGEKQALDEGVKALEAEKSSVDQAAEAAAQRAREEAAAAEAKAAEMAKQQAERDAYVQEGEREYGARMAKAQQDFDAYKNAKVQDYWANPKHGSKAQALIGVALAGIGQALQASAGMRTENSAWNSLQGLIERDIDLQRQEIMKQKDVAATSKENAQTFAEHRAAQLRQLDLKHAAVLERMGVEAEARAKAVGTQDALAKAAAGKAQLDQQAAQLKAKYAEAERQNIQTTTLQKVSDATGAGAAAGGKMTAEAGKAADLAGRMIQDAKALETLPPISADGMRKLQQIAAQDAFYDKNPSLKAAALAAGFYKTPEQLLGDQDRAAYEAGKRFLGNMLRGDSGASITVGDFVSVGPSYIPQPGDKPGNVATKAQARRQVVMGSIARSGPLAPQLQAQLEGRPPEQMAPGGQRMMTNTAGGAQPAQGIRQTRRLKDGRTITGTLMPDGTFHLD